jgi:tripartite-type tricarboxylate transporter receptor subunit TctC
LIAGHVGAAYLAPVVVAQHIRSGKLVALGVAGAKRIPILPEVPTLAEAGLANVEASGWNGLFAPANTPADVVTRVNRDIQALLRQPEVVQRLAALGSIADSGMGTAAFATFMKAERERWAGIVKAIGIKAE